MTGVEHGTRSRYRYGCRCDRCREAEAVHMRAFRAARRRLKPTAETLPVLCWCEASIVDVARSEVLACRTASCGLPGCKAAA